MNGFSEQNPRPATNSIAKAVLCALIAATMPAANATAPMPESAKIAASAINLNYQNKTLGNVADDIKRQSGIEFKIPAELSGDVVSRSAHANTWADAVKLVLGGYNYLGQSGENGKLNQVTVTGRNGNGSYSPANTIKTSASHSGNLLDYQANSKQLPKKYQGYKPGSVNLVSIPFADLSKVKIGGKVPLSLPTGTYDVVHDNVFAHKNGDQTWVGYLDQEGKEYRVVITSGKNGGLGTIITPNGEYQIDLENGSNYLVNVNASGLVHGSLEDDQAVPEPDLFSDSNSGNPLAYLQTGSAPAAAASGQVHKAMGIPAAVAASAEGAAGTADTGPIIVNGVDVSASVVSSVIDVMVVYTAGMDNANLDTRLNQLVALTNQAYLDSKIVMAVRLVGKLKVSYSDTTANTTALSYLTNSSGAFSGVAAARKQLGADLVVLIRPYYKASQLNCGYAWINGSKGTALSASKGFAAVSDGTDRNGTGYWCNDYTFAHETGHTLGNVHERGTNAPTAGAYAFSYGWGVNGTAGTIMSYLRPLVPYFANPNITCNGLACGVPTTASNSADNAATINLTGSKAANFMPTMVPLQ